MTQRLVTESWTPISVHDRCALSAENHEVALKEAVWLFQGRRWSLAEI
jgi:hypothetical protein